MAVTFAPKCFDTRGRVDGGWEAEPRFCVTTDTPDRAADALLLVADRFERVGESGREYGASDWPPDDDRLPSIARVSADEQAAYVYADTDDWLSHRMADTMKFILVEELTRAGVSAVISEDYNPIRGIRAGRWPRKDR